jgi:hypothetical protein
MEGTKKEGEGRILKRTFKSWNFSNSGLGDKDMKETVKGTNRQGI